MYISPQRSELDQDYRENLREMDRLYGDNAQMKAKVEQLEDENKNLEAGLKEVMEAMKKYGGAPEGEGMEKGEREAMVMQFPTLERMLAVSRNILEKTTSVITGILKVIIKRWFLDSWKKVYCTSSETSIHVAFLHYVYFIQYVFWNDVHLFWIQNKSGYFTEVKKWCKKSKIGCLTFAQLIQVLQTVNFNTRTLQAIEAKSVMGRHDTSLFLKAQMDNLQGRNDELRAALRETRHESNKASLELDKALEKV